MTTAYIEPTQTEEQEEQTSPSLLHACAIAILRRAGDYYCRARMLRAWNEQSQHELGSPESVRLAREARDYTDAAARLTARRLKMALPGFLEGRPLPPITTEQWMASGIVDYAPRRRTPEPDPMTVAKSEAEARS